MADVHIVMKQLSDTAPPCKFFPTTILIVPCLWVTLHFPFEIDSNSMDRSRTLMKQLSFIVLPFNFFPTTTLIDSVL